MTAEEEQVDVEKQRSRKNTKQKSREAEKRARKEQKQKSKRANKQKSREHRLHIAQHGLRMAQHDPNIAQTGYSFLPSLRKYHLICYYSDSARFGELV
jgi:ATPase subunit of ABC transporter with duplicated ATPase domains